MSSPDLLLNETIPKALGSVSPFYTGGVTLAGVALPDRIPDRDIPNVSEISLSTYRGLSPIFNLDGDGGLSEGMVMTATELGFNPASNRVCVSRDTLFAEPSPAVVISTLTRDSGIAQAEKIMTGRQSTHGGELEQRFIEQFITFTRDNLFDDESRVSEDYEAAMIVAALYPVRLPQAAHLIDWVQEVLTTNGFSLVTCATPTIGTRIGHGKPAWLNGYHLRYLLFARDVNDVREINRWV